MKIVLLVDGGRPAPQALTAYCEAVGFRLIQITPTEDGWQELLPEAFGLMLLLPAWGSGAYLDSSCLWQHFLAAQYPHLRLLMASYEQVDHVNHLDLLRLADYDAAWWQQTQEAHITEELPYFTGIDLSEKLKRFFAGHGDDSVVAVLSRIRLVVQMASRELQKMQTPYSEIYADLVAPAQLANKWREWRNRWINYYPLFEYTPLAGNLEQIALLTEGMEHWMLAGGKEQEPLANGMILQVLNDMREQLQQIEKQYVVQKLSHTYR
ncbi:MAG: hypothetical protein ACRBG0_03720 [Lewinella sp.]|jgi:hypothetical protein|uniref:hypothetical protein n=1 Tax=Lewinella sp. TaxID=2004506 RepID=UPI003D6AFB88